MNPCFLAREFAVAKKNETEGTAPTTPAGQPANKRQAVEWALNEKGTGFKPLQIKDYVKEKWSIEISPDVASNYKKEYIKKKRRRSKAAAKKKPAAKKPAAKKPAATQEVAVTPAARATTKGSKVVAGKLSEVDVRTLRELAARIGAESLCSLVDAMFR
jgi:hypothetical protein